MLKETFSTADDDTASQLLVAHINDFIPLKLYMFPVFFQFFSSSVTYRYPAIGMSPLLLECHGAIDNESKVRLKASGDGEERMVRGNSFQLQMVRGKEYL